jgi:hypothetical protein
VDDYTQMAFVTQDMQASLSRWHAIGAGPFYRVDLSAIDNGLITDRSYRGSPAKDTFKATIGFLGTTQIELVEPTNDAPSIFREVPDRKNDVLHHMQAKISIVTPDLFDELSHRYEALGMELVALMTTPGGVRSAFYDGRATVGCFLEIAEKGEATFNSVKLMHKAHLRQKELPMIMDWPAS